MPGPASDSRSLPFVGLFVAVVAIVGTTVLGWQFGETDGFLPVALGGGGALVAVAWAISRWTR